jgi:hypothetical protein
MSRDRPRATACAFSALSRSIGFAMLLACTVLDVQDAAAAETVTVGGLTYVNKGLVGVGRLAADLRDKFGETFLWFGSRRRPKKLVASRKQLPRHALYAA